MGGLLCVLKTRHQVRKCGVRNLDDGILLIVTVRVFGKEMKALIDSGASRCFISPTAVVKGGLHSVYDKTVLELADGRRVLSEGKVPHCLINIASSSVKVDCTVSPLMRGIDLILGANWLQLVNPLIDWSIPRLLFPAKDSNGVIEGTWLQKRFRIGQVNVLKNIDTESRLSDEGSKDLSVLRCPTFWSYARSSHSWQQRSQEKRVRSCAAQPDREPASETVQQEQPTAGSRLRQTVRVQGQPHTKTISKASHHRTIVTARNMNKLVRKGETAFLAVVHKSG